MLASGELSSVRMVRARELVADGVGGPALAGAQDPKLAECRGRADPVADLLADGQAGLVVLLGGAVVSALLGECSELVADVGGVA